MHPLGCWEFATQQRSLARWTRWSHDSKDCTAGKQCSITTCSIWSKTKYNQQSTASALFAMITPTSKPACRTTTNCAFRCTNPPKENHEYTHGTMQKTLERFDECDVVVVPDQYSCNNLRQAPLINQQTMKQRSWQHRRRYRTRYFYRRIPAKPQYSRNNEQAV